MPPSSTLEINSLAQGTTHIVAVAGDLDLSSVEAVRGAIDEALAERPETVLLDLSGLVFCDSTGIHLVVAGHKRATERGVRFIVVRPTGPAWRVFELCRIDGTVQFVGSNEDSTNGHSPTNGHVPANGQGPTSGHVSTNGRPPATGTLD
jgi:anti-sigma B factor antagonist